MSRGLLENIFNLSFGFAEMLTACYPLDWAESAQYQGFDQRLVFVIDGLLIVHGEKKETSSDIPQPGSYLHNCMLCDCRLC